MGISWEMVTMPVSRGFLADVDIRLGNRSATLGAEVVAAEPGSQLMAGGILVRFWGMFHAFSPR